MQLRLRLRLRCWICLQAVWQVAAGATSSAATAAAAPCGFGYHNSQLLAWQLRINSLPNLFAALLPGVCYLGSFSASSLSLAHCRSLSHSLSGALRVMLLSGFCQVAVCNLKPLDADSGASVRAGLSEVPWSQLATSSAAIRMHLFQPASQSGSQPSSKPSSRQQPQPVRQQQEAGRLHTHPHQSAAGELRERFACLAMQTTTLTA